MRSLAFLSGALCALFPLALVASSAQDNKGKAVPASMDDMMAAWAKAGALNENHKLLETMAGDWTTTSKMTMDPASPPMESTGTSSGRMIFGGRYLQAESQGTMMGQRMEGQMTMGYDNLKKRFVASWIDSMSTGIYASEGTYDAASKTFTFTGEMDDPITNGKTPYRYTYRIADKDKAVFEWFEERGGKETRTMEGIYTRKK